MSDTPPMPAVPGPPPQRAEVGTAISWAFDRFKSQFWPFVGLASVVFVLWIVQQVAGFIDTGPGGATVLAIVLVVVGFVAQAGVQRAAIRSTQGVRASLDAMLTTQYLGRYILFTICCALVALAGAVPGVLFAVLLANTAGLLVGILLGLAGIIVVYFLLQLGSYYVLDKGYGVGEAMRGSFRVVTKNLGPAVLMTLFTAAVLLMASCCGVLTLVTLPFTTLFTAHLYRQFNGEPIR